MAKEVILSLPLDLLFETCSLLSTVPFASVLVYPLAKCFTKRAASPSKDAFVISSRTWTIFSCSMSLGTDPSLL